jgi:hypothetical protein
MLKVLTVLLAAAMPLQSAMADEFSAKTIPGVPQSAGEVKEAKLWVWVQDEDPNCAVNIDRMVETFSSVAEANKHPRLSLWNNGQPKGPAIAIAVTTTRVSYGSEPLRCLASLSYQFAYFEEYHATPQARIIYQELPNLLMKAPADSVAPGGDMSRGFSAEVGRGVVAIIQLASQLY